MTMTNDKSQMDAQQFCVSLGRNLRLVREQKALSRKYLETHTGIHRNSIERYENGADVPMMAFIRMCVAMGVNAGEILDNALSGTLTGDMK